MAAKPTNPDTVAKVSAEWRTGEYSQRDLAKRHSISAGKVAQITKGVPKDAAHIVSAGVQYRQGLAGQDERIVSAVTEAVGERAKHMTFFNNAQANLAQIALQRIQQQIGDDGKPVQSFSMTELNQASNIVSVSRTGILGKDPETVITNTNAQQNNKLTYEIIK